jgi:hypothetical protein
MDFQQIPAGMGTRCSAAARDFGMRRSAEAQTFLDPPLRAAARGLNGERCSGKKITRKLRFFIVQITKRIDF